jgi:hypothetical protein
MASDWLLFGKFVGKSAAEIADMGEEIRGL